MVSADDATRAPPAQARDPDPLLSPAFAPDAALRVLPPTCILSGGFDPLLDDAVDFNTRLRRLGVPGELRIYRSLPHTFLSFPHLHLLPAVEEALEFSSGWIRAAAAGQLPYSARDSDPNYDDATVSFQ